MFKLFGKGKKKSSPALEQTDESLYSDETEIDTEENDDDIVHDYIDDPLKICFRIKTIIISTECQGLTEDDSKIEGCNEEKQVIVDDLSEEDIDEQSDQ